MQGIEDKCYQNEIVAEMEEIIKLTSFGRANQQLLIRDGALTFDHSSIDLQSVTGLQYGVAAIRLDMFSIGRKYLIALRTKDDVSKIVFKSYMGVSRNYFDRIYKQILDEIWEETILRLIENAINAIRKGETWTIGKCNVYMDGILYGKELIQWADLSYQKNYNRLTINSKSNPKVYTNLYYLENFNVDVLIGILHWIYHENVIEEFINESSATEKTIEANLN
jgi:hypothetical protein